MRRIRMVAVSIAALLVIGASAALAARPKAGTWTGSTSQSVPKSPALTFRVASNHKKVLSFEPVFEGICTKPGAANQTSPVITTDAGRNLAIRNGKFHASAVNGRIHSGSVTLARASDELHGSFISRTKAKGTYSVTFKFNNNAAKYGLAGYTCRTGRVSWTASAG